MKKIITEYGLPVSTPEAEGVSSKGILNFIDSIAERKLELHSFMLLRNGKIISSAWWKPYSAEYRHELYSLSKSFTATAIGIAVDKGLLSIDDKVISFFPEYAGNAASRNLSELSIRHLLTMSTGHADDTGPMFMGQKDWAKVFFGAPLSYKPGTHFKYNSGATYILSVILSRVSGMSLTVFLTDNLFKQLGIIDITWDKCPKGYDLGGAGLNARTQDIAKLGLLYLNRGVWNGRRIVSEKWIDEATRMQISNGTKKNSDWEQGYGFQFWMCRRHIYRGDGAFGQFCIVMPEKNAVLAITSGLKEMQGVLNLAWKHLLPAMKQKAVIPGKDISRKLERRLERLDYLNKRKSIVPNLAELVSGREYMIDPNEHGIESVTFDFTEDKCVFTEKTKNGTSRIGHGCGKWIMNSRYLYRSYLGHSSFKTAGSFRWTGNDRLETTIFLYETPFCRKAVFTFDRDRIAITVKANVGWTDVLEFKFTGRAAST